MDSVSKKQTGIIGEKLAVNYLKNKRFHVLETNFRCREGEIDIIAEKGKCIVFIEVRTKTSSDFGKPEESITDAKKNRIIRTAYHYLNLEHKLDSAWRIDFIAVEIAEQDRSIRMEHIENAISG